MQRNYRRYFEKDVSGARQANEEEHTPVYTHIKNIENSSSSPKATESKPREISTNEEKTSGKGRNINYLFTLALTSYSYKSFNSFILSLGSNYAKYFKIPKKSSRKPNVARKVTLPNNNPRNRKTAKGNKTNFKKPVTNKGGIINRYPTSINFPKTKNSVRKTTLPTNNQRNAAKNYSKLFREQSTTRSRVNVRKPSAINIKKQAPLPILKSENSKDIKRPLPNKSNVIGRNPTPTKVATPTSFQSRNNSSNKPQTKQGE